MEPGEDESSSNLLCAHNALVNQFDAKGCAIEEPNRLYDAQS